MDRIRNVIALFRAQLWPIPAMFIVAAGLLAYALLEYGAMIATDGHWWIYSGDATTARALLGSLLSGLMTMTSLVVSVTFVILTLAANQLGPRLIAIFMADRQIQSVLGIFIGTILYVILVSRTLNDSLGEEGVPQLAVSAASGMTILCLLALLFYIHKVARLIIADNVVEMVAREFRGASKAILAHERLPQPPAPDAIPGGIGRDISICKPGYVQVIDYDALLEVAERADVVMAVHVRAGHHLLAHGKHLSVHGVSHLTEDMLDKVRAAFTIGSERTPAQDIEHGIRQLVEIAARALSPGINDAFTAIAVIDRLGPAIEDVLRFGTQPRMIYDRAHKLRLVVSRSDLAGILGAAIHPIRQAGANHPSILISLAKIIEDLAYMAGPEDKRPLREQLTRLRETLTKSRFPPGDHEDVERSISDAELALDRTGRGKQDVREMLRSLASDQ
jgi:uncharacterized membrane protein